MKHTSALELAFRINTCSYYTWTTFKTLQFVSSIHRTVLLSFPSYHSSSKFPRPSSPIPANTDYFRYPHLKFPGIYWPESFPPFHPAARAANLFIFLDKFRYYVAGTGRGFASCIKRRASSAGQGARFAPPEKSLKPFKPCGDDGSHVAAAEERTRLRRCSTTDECSLTLRPCDL